MKVIVWHNASDYYDTRLYGWEDDITVPAVWFAANRLRIIRYWVERNGILKDTTRIWPEEEMHYYDCKCIKCYAQGEHYLY